MANEIFVDTSGFYALLVRKDDRHRTASRVLRDAKKSKRRFITTDYVLDETATLLKAHGLVHLLNPFFDRVLGSKAYRVEWTDAVRLHAVKDFYLKHADQAWSFTDCVSFCVMKDYRLRDAFTKNTHFEAAGLNVLLK